MRVSGSVASALGRGSGERQSAGEARLQRPGRDATGTRPGRDRDATGTRPPHGEAAHSDAHEADAPQGKVKEGGAS
eukprot:CAMPEP_0119398616 /NCGR_PEP_ID=MMETSP1334-20130426/140937_1 /TAXON_ID=127549 /ORGANISM="Calcidiscus leptoporus, Strain RCC1130" /LENGTH=75 /DNA_ID=CAMNT_0007422485 /DNA_START=450 /DNA_END=677 /DNA_ORIENTATION=+